MLAKSRTGFRRTDSLVNILLVYTINTGLLTGIVAMLCFILYAVMPDTYIFMAIFLNLSKLYLNALLATLNARSNLRDQMNGAISIIPLPGIAESGSDNSSKRIPTSPHIAINFERYTETKPGSLNESTGGYEIWLGFLLFSSSCIRLLIYCPICKLYFIQLCRRCLGHRLVTI